VTKAARLLGIQTSSKPDRSNRESAQRCAAISGSQAQKAPHGSSEAQTKETVKNSFSHGI
jgi:hypothetical protein